MASHGKGHVTQAVQTVILMRHGVAQHNLLDPVTGQRPDLTDPRDFDPPLVYQGKQQALQAGERLRTWLQQQQQSSSSESNSSIELVVVTSPLTRCLQTSLLSVVGLPGDHYFTQYPITTSTTDTSSSSSTPSFRVQKVLSTDRCREAYGVHFPDRRRNLRLLRSHWPTVQFEEPAMTVEDTLWKSDRRETMPELVQRIASFWDYLVEQLQSPLPSFSTIPVIVVVTHGVWMETCLHRYCPDVLEYGQRRVYNCDMFAVNCVSDQGKFLGLEHARAIP